MFSFCLSFCFSTVLLQGVYDTHWVEPNNSTRKKDIVKGVATCTQHYCWGTQQTVKWRNCPSAIILPEEGSSGKVPEIIFPESFRKNLLPEE